MEKYKFKSNINCTGCLRKVAPYLSSTKGIVNWDVELEAPNKILTVEGDHVTANQIEEAVSRAGYKVEQLN